MNFKQGRTGFLEFQRIIFSGRYDTRVQHCFGSRLLLWLLIGADPAGEINKVLGHTAMNALPHGRPRSSHGCGK
jgi:hypothetical protein